MISKKCKCISSGVFFKYDKYEYIKTTTYLFTASHCMNNVFMNESTTGIP